MKHWRRIDDYGKKRHRWALFCAFVAVGAISLFFVGVARRELWILLVLAVYLIWVTRRD